jgi:hypothetical protein
VNILDLSNIYDLRSMPRDGGLIDRCWTVRARGWIRIFSWTARRLC